MNSTTTKDIFSNSFIAMQNGLTKISPIEIVLNLSVSFFIALFIFYIYKKSFQGVLYQRSFNISLIAISMVTTLVIMTISRNLILSLGMVGALSIVRFRTPIKDPIDLVFIFWSITVGIANGVGQFNISIIGSILLTIVLLFMNREKSEAEQPYLLIMQLLPNQDPTAIIEIIEKSVDRFLIKSQTLTINSREIIAEIRLNSRDIKLLNILEKESIVQKATIINYSGDMGIV